MYAHLFVKIFEHFFITYFINFFINYTYYITHFEIFTTIIIASKNKSYLMLFNQLDSNLSIRLKTLLLIQENKRMTREKEFRMDLRLFEEWYSLVFSSDCGN